MEFKNWVKREARINQIISLLIEEGHDLIDLVEKDGLFSRLRKMFFKKEEPVEIFPTDDEERKSDPEEEMYNQMQRHVAKGYKADPSWQKAYNSMRDKATGGKYNKDMDKVRDAMRTLRNVLREPKFQPILDTLDRKIEGNPAWYDHMTDGEKGWYDRLDHPNKIKFDDEMLKYGFSHVRPEDRDFVSSRAEKASRQGYHDRDANWKWAAGFANRQRIRRSMDPSWADHLQGENTHFRLWLKNKLTEDMQSGVAANRPGEVQAPTDPKEIARRKVVNNTTSQMMKKNPNLEPGNTPKQMVANAINADPAVAKTDAETQQAVSSFFMKKQN